MPDADAGHCPIDGSLIVEPAKPAQLSLTDF
jgi:hypothetical protein